MIGLRAAAGLPTSVEQVFRTEDHTTRMKIGYLIADFPVLSETFVVNDIRGLEDLGHEVVAVSLGTQDPATVGNPNYTIKGRTVRV